MPQAFVNQEAARRARRHIGFSFGANWQKFIRTLDEPRIAQAEASLRHSFGGHAIASERFIDVGCGSGLFSLCAARLGASEVVSIDVDPNSIASTATLRRRFGAGANWTVLQGSALDRGFLAGIPPATRVYSWGVLHHTGAMWEAIENVLTLVAPGGLLCLGLYTRPYVPALHMALKQTYNHAPELLRPGMVAGYGSALLTARTLWRRRNPVSYVRDYGRHSMRGMSFWRDVEDWLGGLPIEYCTESEMRAFSAAHGCELVQVIRRAPGANNEYLLRKAVETV